MKSDKQTRRTFIGKLALASAGAAFAESDIVAGCRSTSLPIDSPTTDRQFTACSFSKMFDALGEDMFALLADAGFEGVDLTVRPRGYVLPENIEKDLPRAVNAAQKKGLSVPMIATVLTDASDPLTERILQTASAVGVKYYRLGYFKYDWSLTAEQNMRAFRQRLDALSELNARYGLQGSYQNHTDYMNGMFGSALWDLWMVIKDMDPRRIGCQYDIHHSVIEGFTSWPSGLRTISPHVRNMCVKDFVYERDGNGKWFIKEVPLGEGVVDFKMFFDILKERNIQGPISVHYEFLSSERPYESLPKAERLKKLSAIAKKEADTLKMMIAGK